MKHFCISLLAFLFLSSLSSLSAQPIKGAWKMEKSVLTANGETTENDTSEQPSLILFTDKHYSFTLVSQGDREPVPSGSNRESMTGDQWKSIAQWYVSNAGTYEMKGNKLTRTYSIALFPNAMGITATAEIDVKGNKMTWKESGGEGDGAWMRVTTLSRIK